MSNSTIHSWQPRVSASIKTGAAVYSLTTAPVSRQASDMAASALLIISSSPKALIYNFVRPLITKRYGSLPVKRTVSPIT